MAKMPFPRSLPPLFTLRCFPTVVASVNRRTYDSGQPQELLADGPPTAFRFAHTGQPVDMSTRMAMGEELILLHDAPSHLVRANFRLVPPWRYSSPHTCECAGRMVRAVNDRTPASAKTFERADVVHRATKVFGVISQYRCDGTRACGFWETLSFAVWEKNTST